MLGLFLVLAACRDQQQQTGGKDNHYPTWHLAQLDHTTTVGGENHDAILHKTKPLVWHKWGEPGNQIAGMVQPITLQTPGRCCFGCISTCLVCCWKKRCEHTLCHVISLVPLSTLALASPLVVPLVACQGQVVSVAWKSVTQVHAPNQHVVRQLLSVVLL